MPRNAFFLRTRDLLVSQKTMQRHFFSTLHPLSTVIFATATVLAFVLLRNSRFNFHCYTQREAMPTQKSARKCAATSRNFLRERLQSAFTLANQLRWIAQYGHYILSISTLLIVLLLSEYVHLIFRLSLPSLHYCGFCFQLFSGFDASEAYVVVLNTLPTHRFTSEVPTSDLPVPILRGLKTSKFAGTPMCSVLEQPNLVSGLAAQG